MPVGQALAVTAEDRSVATYMIQELRYFDSATRLLDSLVRQRGLTKKGRAEIASLRIDILYAQGKNAEAKEAQAEFKKAFPEHARASLSDLETISRDLGDVVELYTKASLDSDPKRTEKVRERADTRFEEKVRGPLEATIKELESRVADAKEGPKQDDAAESRAVLGRDRAELTRLKAYLVYAKALPAGSERRKEILEAGRALAGDYVENRYDYPVMQYEGQLQRGFYAYELARYQEAEDHLALLYAIKPPPFASVTTAMVKALKTLRLQAILYGARSLAAVGEFNRALGVVEKHFLEPSEGPLDLSQVETDPDLRKFGVLLRLEYGIVLAGGGRARQGLEVIQAVIAKYAKEPGAEATAFVTDARKALGRVATLGGVVLGPKDYYEAAIGLKSEFLFEAALEALQTALAGLEPGKDMRAYAPQCLNEIGEISFRLGRHVESALAYAEYYRFFALDNPELTSRVARNFLAATTKAVDTVEGGETHVALLKLKAEATQFSDEHGVGLGNLQALMVDAGSLQKRGKYDEARKKYLEVPETWKGEKVPFYWRAQASAWGCECRAWEAAGPAEKKKLERRLTTALSALEGIVPEALEAGDLSGAAAASVTLGQTRYQRDEWEAAVEALKIFAGELANEEFFRCQGLAYLILAEVQLEACSDGKKHFKRLLKACRTEPAVAICASALADGFKLQGKPRTAATLTLIYARHPSSREEMRNIEPLIRVAEVVIEGGRVKDAEPFISKAKKLAGGENSDLERRLLLLDAKALASDGKWSEVTARYEEYLKEFASTIGEHYEDPYVYKNLADAYVQLAGKPAQLKAIQKADRYYGSACALMQGRKGAAPDDKKIEKTFWRWLLAYLTNKSALVKAGDGNAKKSIVAMVEEYSHTDMGGLKKKFLKLGREAGGRSNRSRSGGSNR
jgi:hypothetical protein